MRIDGSLYLYAFMTFKVLSCFDLGSGKYEKYDKYETFLYFYILR